MSRAVPSEPFTGRSIALTLLLAALYVLSGRAGLELASYQDNATLIWPPSGLALAALTLAGRRLWPGVLLGAFIVNAWVDTPLTVALMIAVGNTLEAVIGSWLLTRVGALDLRFARLRDVLTLVSLGALVPTVVSASVGVAALGLGGLLGGRDPLLVWIIWWLGDAGGVITVAPLVLVGVHGAPAWSELARRTEAWLVFGLLGLSAWVPFGGALAPGWVAELFAFLPFPFCVWAGMRLGPRGAVSASLLIGVVAGLGTASSVGPFVLGDPHQRMLLLFAYVTTLGSTAMILAAAIAEREAIELERRVLEVRVERAQRLEALGALAGGVAHDFNNLLTVMRTNAELSRLETARGEPIAARLAAIETTADRAAELCRQLLTYAGKATPELAPVDLGRLTKEMTALLESALPKSVQLALELEPASPAVHGDPTQLRQLVMNLVVNAADAIGVGRPGRIVVRTRRGESSRRAGLADLVWSHPGGPTGAVVILEVEDDGCGMERATLDRIFEPFFTTKAAGRGLGMATVLGVVSAHRGAIGVRSVVDGGTVFSIQLPVSERAAVETEKAPSRPRRTGTILLADDEPLVRGILGELLSRAGWTVDEAEDGEEAVSRFSDAPERYDVVLLDATMPGLSGPEALARMRAVRVELPAILMSGGDPGEVSAAGDVIFLRKPFDAESLREALDARVARDGLAHDPPLGHDAGPRAAT